MTGVYENRVRSDAVIRRTVSCYLRVRAAHAQR